MKKNKGIDKDGRPVHREYHKIGVHDFGSTYRVDKKGKIVERTFEDTYLEVLLKLTPKHQLEVLEKHFKKPVNNEGIKLIPGVTELHLMVIFEKYKSYFSNETSDIWVNRFQYPAGVIPGITVSEKATEDSSKLVLMAILSKIQETTGEVFIFNDFVRDRFGIKGFHKAVSVHKEKETFRKVEGELNNIMKLFRQ